MRRHVALLLLVLCAACKPAQKAPPPKDGVSQVRATVVPIGTTIGDKTTTHNLVIAGDKARFTNELDAWRLFDTKANTVTYVDDAARTFRTERVDDLLRERRKTLASVLPAHYPTATIKASGETRAILGVNAQKTVIEVGAYKRELWLAEHNAIPRGLFAMMQASDPPSSPLAPMMRAADEVLTRTRAFPLIDRAEIPGQYVVERNVGTITQQNVPAALLAIPRGYRDLTPKPPAARK